MAEDTRTIEEIFNDGHSVVRAARRAVREALRRHKLLGHPVAVWRDGRVVWIPPEEIVIQDDPEDVESR